MHPAAYYALNIGSKIEKPKIYLKYQPIHYKKYQADMIKLIQVKD